MSRAQQLDHNIVQYRKYTYCRAQYIDSNHVQYVLQCIKPPSQPCCMYIATHNTHKQTTSNKPNSTDEKYTPPYIYCASYLTGAYVGQHTEVDEVKWRGLQTAPQAEKISRQIGKAGKIIRVSRHLMKTKKREGREKNNNGSKRWRENLRTTFVSNLCRHCITMAAWYCQAKKCRGSRRGMIFFNIYPRRVGLSWSIGQWRYVNSSYPILEGIYTGKEKDVWWLRGTSGNYSRKKENHYSFFFPYFLPELSDPWSQR